ncbi:MAG: hypothetical protein IT558_06325 [Alphaproteobacteria bacterium]|nr:hypothetical protein [Alphaproteobacteria bacterium]
MRLVLSIIFIALAFAPAAQAQTFQMEMEMEPEQHAGVPDDTEACVTPLGDEVDTEPRPGFCDIRTRILAYRDENIEMRRQLEERREKYIVPQLEAVANYKSRLDDLHNGY